MAQAVKNPPAMRKTGVRPLGGEDPLEEGMATHSSIPTWKIPWTEEPGGLYSPWDHEELDMTESSWHACTHPLNRAFYFYQVTFI